MALPPELFGFLEELKDNNDRTWFQANKSRYEEQVKSPLLAFIGGFDERLQRLSPHFVADPRPVGGSMFRIYRDVRFAKDKSPYKTAAGIHFRHERAKDVHAPGYYLHLEPAGDVRSAGNGPVPTIYRLRTQPSMHLGYVVQWGMSALTILFLYILIIRFLDRRAAMREVERTGSGTAVAEL